MYFQNDEQLSEKEEVWEIAIGIASEEDESVINFMFPNATTQEELDEEFEHLLCRALDR